MLPGTTWYLAIVMCDSAKSILKYCFVLAGQDNTKWQETKGSIDVGWVKNHLLLIIKGLHRFVVVSQFWVNCSIHVTVRSVQPTMHGKKKCVTRQSQTWQYIPIMHCVNNFRTHVVPLKHTIVKTTVFQGCLRLPNEKWLKAAAL